MTGDFSWWASAGGSPRSGVARSALPLALLLLTLACGAPRRDPPTHIAPWLREDPHRCLLQRDLSESMEQMAQRCAEAFVRENGYTPAPATGDSTRWVLERDERGPWGGVFADRVGTLDADASAVQCSARQCVVLFRLRRNTLDCAYRVLRMSQVFTRLQLEPGGIRYQSCGERQA